MPRPGGSTHSTKVKPSEPRPFVIRRGDGRWYVKQGERWMPCREVSLLAPAILKADGEIVGDGVATKHGAMYTVTS